MARMHFLILITLCSTVYFGKVVKADCGGLISETSGVITSPSYPHPYPPLRTCTWEIKMPPNNRIGLRFMTFVLEEQSSCNYDSVTVKSKMEDGAIQNNGKFCGSKAVPFHIISDSNNVLIEFKSDPRKEYEGFKIEFFNVPTECGGMIETSEGVITSLLFPFHYPPQTQCIWNITAPLNHNIRLIFTDFELENSEECDNAYVKVQSKMANGEIREQGKFCGGQNPAAIFSESNNMLIQFVSNNSLQNNKGFRAEFLTDGCGGLVEGSKGIIRSQYFPDSYLPDKMCKWEFLVPPQHKLKLHFLYFETEGGGGDCSNDFLLIQSRTEDGDVYEYGKYCGDSGPPTIYSKDNLVVTFVSDHSLERKGFKAEYAIDKLTDYEISTSMRTFSTPEYVLDNSTTVELHENVTSRHKPDTLSDPLKILTEKVTAVEEKQKTMIIDYENILKISRLLASKNAFLKDGGKNSSSSFEKQLSNDCGKFIFFLRRMLDLDP